MSLQVHARSHPDDLVGLLVDQLAVPPEDPFAAEVVAVPTRGIERWLTQRISSELADRGNGDGVCANVWFPSPRRLVFDVMRAVPVLAPGIAAWEGNGLVGHVLDALDAHRKEEWLWMLDRYLGEPDRQGGSRHRMDAARKIALLFGRYARRRPQMIRAWAAGKNVEPNGSPISLAAQWQPRLWRIVRQTIGIPSLPELLPEGLSPISTGEITLPLPPRLAVYGLTALDPLDLQVLEAVAARHDVCLYLLHPSPALWHRMASLPGEVAGPRGRDPSRPLVQHPLLESWGRESRELQLVLRAEGHGASGGPVPTDVGEDAAVPTLLGSVQDDIRHNRSPAPNELLAREVMDGTDRSVQIHVAHGARRQAEVARDAVLQVLATDPSLEPRDIVIMTPDLATFGPLLEAAFPTSSARDTADELPDLRVRIADRAPAATNPLVRFAATVLDLADSRLAAGTVRDLIAEPAVRQRFAIDEDTAGALNRLIADVNVAWGIDGDHRAIWGAGDHADRTWRRSLDRALAGVYLADDPTRIVATIAPLDGVEGQDADVAGLLAQLIDRIAAVRDHLAVMRPRSGWAEAISGAVRLLAAPSWDDEWQWTQLDRLLGETFAARAGAGAEADPLIGRAEAALLVTDWTQDRPSPLHFRTGDVTVCTLVPMRSVPYRVVCLVGMDDELFPRSGSSDGDDLLLDDEVIGDPDRAAEDRQLLMDAVMAAGDHLLITYSGRDELTNAEYPPAVPVSELKDVLTDMVGRVAAGRLVTKHPLQGFSRINFVPGKLGVHGPWSFDPMQLDGARAIQAGPPMEAADSFLPGTFTALPGEVALDDLIAFLRNPAKWFLRNRLQLTIPERREIPDDTLATDIGGLDLWKVKEALLEGRVGGYPLDALGLHVRGQDAVPPGRLGLDDLEKAAVDAEELASLAARYDHVPARRRRFAGSVPAAGRAVTGSVEADATTHRMSVVTASRVRASRRLEAFARLVFLTALEPETAWEALLIGRGESGSRKVIVTIGPIGGDANERAVAASELLGGLVDLYLEAHARPLPLPADTAYVWQRNLGKGRGSALFGARKEWESGWYPREAAEVANAELFGNVPTIEALVATDFPDLAARLWGPILPLFREKTP